jgi:DNA-binding CsgD family transcriptional regulator
VPGFRSEVMVGRERELATLRELAAGALAGNPATAVLLGEAGIGKTRLALELVSDLATTDTLCPVSRGVELAGDELPFGATSQLLRSLVRAIGVDPVRRAAGPELPTLAALHPGLDPDGPGRVDPPAVFGAVQTLLESVGRPVCWVLDDLPWMDAASRNLVGYLARVLTDVPILLLATVRTAPPAFDALPDDLLEVGRGAHVLPLAPLDRQSVAAQAAALRGHDLPPEQVERIATRSDGIPFFVEQLVAHGTDATGSLRAVVLAEVRTLSPPARSLLAAAAIGEGLLRPTLLRRVAEVEDVEAALSELRECGALRVDADGELLQFRHALLREAIESELLAEERRELHDRWASVLDEVVAGGPSDRAAVIERARHHYAVGGPGALGPVRDAAWAAEHVDDDRVRARWWGRALELSPTRTPGIPDLDRDLTLARYVAALWATGDPDVVERLLAAELEHETDPLRSLWLRLAHWRTQRAMQLTFAPALPITEADETVRTLAACRPAPGQRDVRIQEVRRDLAHAWRFIRPDLAGRLLEELLVDLDPRTDREVVVDAYWDLGVLEAGAGDADAMPRRMEEALRWMHTHGTGGQLGARGMLAVALVNAGRLDAARALAEDTVRQVREPVLRPQLWVVQHLTLATTALLQGDWPAVDRFLRAVHEIDFGGDLATWWHTVACAVAARRGQLGLARQELDALLAVAPIDRDDGGDMERVNRAMAELEIAVADQDSSVTARVATSVSAWTAPGMLADEVWEAWVGCFRARGRPPGDAPSALPADAAAALERDLVHLNRAGRIAQAWATELEARLAESSTTGVEAAAAAVSTWHALARPYDAAWCRLFEAECAARDRDRDRASTALAEAWRTADRLGALPLRERVETAARRWSIEGVGRAAPAPGLTTRETEVLALLAEGLTNAQIAERLFMSPKTASVHVSHVIAKLGVANRTEAAAQAHRRGLVAEPPLPA